MTWLTVKNNQKIFRIITYLIFERTKIKIQMGEEKLLFTSRFIKIILENPLSDNCERPQLIIEKLTPEKGNVLIQSKSRVTVEFFINENLCRCNLEYIGINPSSHIGFILSFPESIEIEEKRREERFAYNTPEFISAEFKLGNKSRHKTYTLNVLNCSKHGLGLIITQKDFDLLEVLHKGDWVDDITVYASWAMIKVNGAVKHITKLKNEKFKGCYFLGIETPDIIENCRPDSR